MMAVEHIPAWRKLGLKLKSEELSRADHLVLPTIEPAHAAKKRKLALPDGIGDHIRAVTRERPVNGVDGTEEGPRRSSLARSYSSSSSDQMHTPQTSPRKRKSVSFTPDTKIEDGGKNLKPLHSPRLDAPPNLFDVYMSEATGAAELLEGQSIAPEDTSKEKKETKDKKAKKEKKQKTQSASTEELSPSSQPMEVDQAPTEDTPPQLQYLNEYHNSRSTWKFNKGKQNWLLNNALDLTKIPSNYNAALEQYIRGLDSKMARLRLFERAKEAVAADDEALAKEASAETNTDTTAVTSRKRARSPSPHDPENDIYTDEARIADQAAALNRIREQVRRGQLQREEDEFRHSKEFQRRLHNRRRAELLLWATEPSSEYFASAPHPLPTEPVKISNSKTVFTSEPAATTTGNAPNGTESGKTKRRRRRRRRTGVDDDDTSSSESDSSAASDDSDMQRIQKHARAIVKNQPLQLGSPVRLEKEGDEGSDASSKSTSESPSESNEGDTSSSGPDESDSSESESESESEESMSDSGGDSD